MLRAIALVFAVWFLGISVCVGSEVDEDLSPEIRKELVDDDFFLSEQKKYDGIRQKMYSHIFKSTYFTCPILVYYPQQLGNDAVDALVARQVKTWFDESKEDLEPSYKESLELARLEEACREGRLDLEQGLSDAGERIGVTCENNQLSVPLSLQKWFSMTTYELFYPSRTYVSLIFSSYVYGGGAHSNLTYQCMTFDIASGTSVDISLLLPSEDVKKKLAQTISAKLRVKRNVSMPDLTVDEADLSMSRITLNLGGLLVWYAPYEQGSYAEGAFQIAVSKEELSAMGVDMRFWE